MLENARFLIHRIYFRKYVELYLEACDVGATTIADKCSRKALIYGSRALELIPKANRIREKDIDPVRRLVDDLRNGVETSRVYRDFSDLAPRIKFAAEEPSDAAGGLEQNLDDDPKH